MFGEIFCKVTWKNFWRIDCLNDVYRVLYICQNSKNLLLLVGAFYVMLFLLNTVVFKNARRYVNPLFAIYEKNIFPNLLLFLGQNLLSSILFIFLYIVQNQIRTISITWKIQRHSKMYSIVSKLGYLCIWEIAKVLLWPGKKHVYGYLNISVEYKWDTHPRKLKVLITCNSEI